MRHYIGMSGWTFPGWRGGFYPKGTVQKKELEFASRKVTSIEINGTFYKIQKPSTFQSWYDATPQGFVFAVKAPQYITHIRRLKEEIETPVANFFASGLFRLKEKLGPILWQFPPNMMLKDDRFEKFIKLLPKTPAAASKVSKGHSSWLKGSAETSSKQVPAIRHAFEFRHPSFFNADFLGLLRENNIAVVFAHGGDEKLYIDTPTADFVYARMQGQGKEFAKGYPKKTLQDWRKQIAGMAKIGVKEAFTYFGTEKKKYSPLDALNLIEIVNS